MISSICSPGSTPNAKSLTGTACTALSKNELTASAGPVPSRFFKARSVASSARMSSRKHSRMPAVIMTRDATSSIPAHQSAGASLACSQYPARATPFQVTDGSNRTGSASVLDGAGGSRFADAWRHASASLVAGSASVPLRKAPRNRRVRPGVSASCAAFSRYDPDVVAKDVQGESRRTPARGAARRGGGTDMDGCGCSTCESADMQSAPPAESPAMTSDDGGMR